VREAIAAYTREPAFASYEEERKGTITEGKLADLAVISQDILALAPERIADAQVDVTVLGGRVIFERGSI
jgi:hypothetical protein